MRTILLLIMALLTTPALAAEQTVQGPSTALASDAASYATAHGVSPEEGLRRLRLQLASIGAAEHLRVQFADRLAGLFVEHQPEWRLVVLMTGDVPPTRLLMSSGGMQIPVELRGGAGATRAAVLAALDAHRSALSTAVPGIRGMGADPRTGTLLVFQRAASAVEAVAVTEGRLSGIAGVPVR